MDGKTVKEWHRHRRQSLRRLPIQAGLIVVLCLFFYGLSRFVAVPSLLVAVFLGLAAFTFIGDAVNVVYLGRKLRGVIEDGDLS
jgi:hypothetical protein